MLAVVALVLRKRARDDDDDERDAEMSTTFNTDYFNADDEEVEEDFAKPVADDIYGSVARGFFFFSILTTH